MGNKIKIIEGNNMNTYQVVCIFIVKHNYLTLNCNEMLLYYEI